jgi:hypothetical protein
MERSAGLGVCYDIRQPVADFADRMSHEARSTWKSLLEDHP